MAYSNRNSHRMVGFAITTALASATLAGCAGQAAAPANVSAAKAEKAMQAGKVSKAVELAEAAVLADPRNAEYRAKLGSAYLEDGRFASAVTAFDDAMKLGEASPRTALSLALALTATGRGGEAQAILDDWDAEIAESDIGLAYTLAGNPQRGIHILSNAVRGGDDSAKTRQNLAYSFAMAGQWREARLMAMQDVPGDQVGKRMEEWAAAAHGGSSATRIAKLLNVQPAQSDQGMPIQLALSNNPSDTMLAAQAQADDAALLAANSGNGELPALAMNDVPPPPPPPAPAEAPYQAPYQAPALPPLPGSAAAMVRETEPQSFAQAFDAPAQQAAPAASRAPVRSAAAAPASRPMPLRKASAEKAPSFADAGLQSPGSHLVQLGSFASEAGARRAWGIYVKRYPELADHQMVITQAVVRGKNYWRVSAGGYQRAAAASMCSKVKSGGKGCFAWADGRPMPGAVDRGTRMARNDV